MKHYLTKVRVLAMVLCAVLCLNTSINVMPVYATGVDAVEATDVSRGIAIGTEEMQASSDVVTTEVIIDANGGMFNVITTDGIEYMWQIGSYTAMVEVGATLFDAGARPTQLINGDKRFVGWSVWEKNEAGSYVDAGVGYLLTPNMETYTISDKPTKFVAEWIEPGTATVQINCYDGSFNLTQAGETTQTDSFFGTYEAGKTLAECGISLSAAVNADGKTGFEGWEVYYMLDDMMFPYNVYTAETLSEFELPVGAVFIVPRWEPPVFVTVEFYGNGGSFDFTMNGEAWESSYYNASLEEGKTLAECGITITEPVHDDSRVKFLYWAVCQMNEMGVTDILGTYTTAELMNYVVPDKLVFIEAQWEYPMSCEVRIKAYGGSFQTTVYGTDEAVDNIFVTLIEGETLASANVSVTTPIHSEEGTQFSHWSIRQWDAETKTYRFVGEYTTEEMLTYPINEADIEFYAQWSGEQDVYYGNVCIDGNGGTFDILVESEYLYEVDSYYSMLEIGSCLGDYDFGMWEVENGDKIFAGWTLMEMDETGNYVEADFKYYDTNGVREYIITDTPIKFVALWLEPGTTIIEIECVDGTFNLTENGKTREVSSYYHVLETGKTLAEDGILLSDAVNKDGETAFESWCVDWLQNDAYMSHFLHTTESLLERTFPEALLYITPYWEQPRQVNVEFWVDNGSFDLTDDGDTTTLSSYNASLEVGKTIAECGITITDPVHEDSGIPFLYWTVFQLDKMGMIQTYLGEYTTAELMNYIVPDDSIRIYAQWDYPMDCRVRVKAYGGSFQMTADGTTTEADSFAMTLSEGETLKEYGVSIDTPVFLEEGTRFSHWSIRQWDAETETYSFVGEYTTEEILAYPITEVDIEFYAQWSGDKNAYYGSVCIDGNGGTFNLIIEDESLWQTDFYVSAFGVDSCLFDYNFGISELTNGDKHFVGWSLLEKDESGNYVDVGYLYYDTTNVGMYTITDKPIKFVAQWLEPGTAKVEIKSYDGTFCITENGESREVSSYSNSFEAGKTLAECGISLLDAVNEDGESVFEWDVNTMIGDMVGAPNWYTLEALLNYTLPEAVVIIKPCWEVNVEINGNGGSFELVGYDGTSIPENCYMVRIHEGISLAECGVSITDPVFSDGVTQFSHWSIRKWDDETESYSLVGEYTTEEMLACPMSFSLTDSNNIVFYAQWKEAGPEAQVRAFLERMYTVALGRATDPSGVDYWTNQLLSHADDGATVSRGFILGDEFVGKNYSNEEFVTILYSTFFDRTADEGGKAYWSSILEGGATRASVLAGFVNSNEFFVLCNEFGISRGVLRGDGSAINPGIYQFSERLYSEILERQGDMVGIEYWTIQLDERAITPEHAAAGFFFGGEYLAKNTTNEQYVQALYRTFMGREAEADGLGYWKGVLESGTDRMTVLWALAGCAEFQTIKQQYGL